MPPSPPHLAEADYEAIRSALVETPRGRRFLAEHARRSRTEDTKLLLKALERIEQLIRERPCGTAPAEACSDPEGMTPVPAETAADSAAEPAVLPAVPDDPGAAPTEAALDTNVEPEAGMAGDLRARLDALTPEQTLALFG